MPNAEPLPQSSRFLQARHFPTAFWALLALTAAVRLIAVTRPLLGNFATKNVVYAMIARNLAEGRASLWYPMLDVLAGGERSWHMLEFPVSAYLTAGLWHVLGGSLDVWGRATAVAFSVASVALIFLLVRRRHGQTAAVGAALALALAPVSVIYGQSFMLEASLVFFTLGTFYALDRRLTSGHFGWLVAAGICLALLLLTKIYMLVVLLPLTVTVLRRSRSIMGSLLTLLVIGLATIPAAFWYAHALRTAVPDGPFSERVFYSVRDSAEVHAPPHPRLGSADFYRQVLDDLTGVVLTPVGFMLALAGFSDRRWRQYVAWLPAMLILVLALPLKFYEMNYYWMAVLPPLCILVGLGWQAIQRRLQPGRTATAVLLVAAVVLSFRYACKPAFVTPEEDRGVVAAARALRELTDANEPVVTMHGTAPDLLYYCDRRGWVVAADARDLDSLLADYRRRGARYVVVVGKGPPLPEPVGGGENFRIHRLPGP
ncbi:MAG TPA: glycosyltransferase family 39 protein [Thermoguttaceae bacterium]|nr:glycosyltransferase family 39 protein [Thermoguttaceae bacterium]